MKHRTWALFYSSHETQSSFPSALLTKMGSNKVVIGKLRLFLFSVLNTNVAVTVGIQWDNIDEIGIKAVIENSRQLVKIIIERITAKKLEVNADS